jgi:FlaA1/EpsC-like NDP-sugar epimerase
VRPVWKRDCSRGSIVPLFVYLVRKNQPITITLEEMTAFLLTLNRALIRSSRNLDGGRGETFVPKVARRK